jgi:hypothetical protein
VTLGEWFESMGLSEQVAGGAYLIELASTTPSAANITAYAEIVRDKAVLRQLIDVGTNIVNEGFMHRAAAIPAKSWRRPRRRSGRSADGCLARQAGLSPRSNKALSKPLPYSVTRYANCGGVTVLPTATRIRRDDAGLHGPSAPDHPSGASHRWARPRLRRTWPNTDALKDRQGRGRCSRWKCPPASWRCA